ncbi:PREDICTED: uncharacterized protein LOC109584704 [Amphimedon queenslandica]|uniref:Uncharacterized protein n=1 Tax=Amphimedon queenslandica TaxID=400682 RepID=A0A1X7U545_AMPQE|nr:PREDICTED: uncharacterized protein LOC109584704 [Amphimedon queenslandica]|eukprot:XP_019856095.1 PREDICTED: uncharacterized protein LOC109584704 [Amphimedon queenslandica]
MALSIKFRGDSSSELDAVKDVLQSLSISEENVTIVKKAGGDIKIKATINTTVKVQEFSLASTGAPAAGDAIATFITVSFPGCFMTQLSSTSESQLSNGLDKNEKPTKNIKDFCSNLDLSDCLSKQINSSINSENIGDYIISIRHADMKQYMKSRDGSCYYIVQVEFSGNRIGQGIADDICEIIYKLFDHTENDKFKMLQDYYGTKAPYTPTQT